MIENNEKPDRCSLHLSGVGNFQSMFELFRMALYVTPAHCTEDDDDADDDDDDSAD
jgi:hypothetical protein